MSAIHEQQPEFARHFANSLFKVIDHADHQATDLLQRVTAPSSSKTGGLDDDNNNNNRPSAVAAICQFDADVAAHQMRLHSLSAVTQALPPASELVSFGEKSLQTLTTHLDALETHLQLYHHLPPVTVYEALATTPPATPQIGMGQAPPFGNGSTMMMSTPLLSARRGFTGTTVTGTTAKKNVSSGFKMRGELRTPSPEPVPPPPKHQLDPLAAFPKTPRMEDFGLDDSSLQDLRNETHNLSLLAATQTPVLSQSYTPITTRPLPNRALTYDEDEDEDEDEDNVQPR